MLLWEVTFSTTLTLWRRTIFQHKPYFLGLDFIRFDLTWLENTVFETPVWLESSLSLYNESQNIGKETKYKSCISAGNQKGQFLSWIQWVLNVDLKNSTFTCESLQTAVQTVIACCVGGRRIRQPWAGFKAFKRDCCTCVPRLPTPPIDDGVLWNCHFALFVSHLYRHPHS